MIYKVEAQNPKGEIVEMTLTNPEKSGLNITNITGISPVGAEIYSVPFASVDGAVYAGSRVPSRNIVMEIAMHNEDLGDGVIGSIEDSRLKTYNFFQLKDSVTLWFYTDRRTLSITGYVESNEVDIFSDKEVATISIICVDPWFYSVSDSSGSVSGTMGMFEFPFSTEHGNGIYPERIEFGRVSVDTRTDIFYKGDIKNGVTMHIGFSGKDFHDIHIMNVDTREKLDIYTDQIRLITGDPLSAGDELIISTVSGKKSAYLLRNGIYTNVISVIDKNSDWLQLTKGSNVFAISSDYGVENISVDMVFSNAYAGI